MKSKKEETKEIEKNEELIRLKKSNDKKKATIIVLIFAMILIVMIAVLLFMVLNQDKSNNIQNPNNDVDVLANDIIIETIENDKIVRLPNGKDLKIVEDSVEFIDDSGKKYTEDVYTYYVGGIKVEKTYSSDAYEYKLVITNKYVLIVESLQCGDKFSFAFDLNGNAIKINEDYHELDYAPSDSGACKEAGLDIETLKINDNRLFINTLYFSDTLEIIYNGESITIRKID